MNRKIKTLILPLLLTVCMALTGCSGDGTGTESGGSAGSAAGSDVRTEQSSPSSLSSGAVSSMSVSDVPAYSGDAYAVISDNVPDFTDSDLTTQSYESYGDLDTLGRCTTCVASVGKDLMPTEKRGSIGMIRPTGWHTVKYDWVDGKYLYNRCHLIGYQLTGENANEKNLITGTRYMNTEGMLPFENMVADYVKETGNHVLYRVTPVFDGDNLVAGGVHMEAESVEDNGAGVEFNVYCYNVQPGVTIDYTDGSSSADGTMGSGSEAASSQNTQSSQDTDSTQNSEESSAAQSQDSTAAQSGTSTEQTYIINVNTGKFHYPSCSSVKRMNESNKRTVTESRDQLVSEGYSPCQNCNP